MNMDKFSPITYGAAVAAAEEILGNAGGITDEVITEKTNVAVQQYVGTNDIAKVSTNYYDATKYGVLPTNEDNTDALQDLIDKVYNAGGGTIYIPNGEYHFKWKKSIYAVLLKPDVSIIGENKYLTKLIMDDCTDVSYTLFYRHQGKQYPLANCTFANFTVDGSALTQWAVSGKVFYCQYVTDCTFKDLVLVGTPATALGIDYLSNVIIDSIICIDCGHLFTEGKIGSSGIGIGCGGYENENFTISNNICVGSGQYGIFVENQTLNGWGGEYNTTKGMNIINNIVRNGLNCGIGVRGQSGATISGNTVYGNAKHGIYTDGCFLTTISGNTVFDNTENGIYVNPSLSDVQDLVVSGNNITGNNIGLLISNKTDKKCEGVNVVGNYIRNNTVGLSLFGEMKDICIKGNGVFDSIDNSAIITGKSILDADIPENLFAKYESECKYNLDSAKSYKYKMIMNLGGTYYLYCSNSPMCIYKSGEKYSEAYAKDVQMCTTTETESDTLAGMTYSTELDDEYSRFGSVNRTLSQFVWSNHDLILYGADTVLVTAGTHE